MPDSDTAPEGPRPSRPPLVLIANDQEWSARSLESILSPSGYAVLRAYTGRQAFELARSVQPDLLIVDAKLPDISGSELCAMLREDARVGVSTPIIVTTSDSAERSPSLEAYRAGAWEFLRQPIDAEVFLLKLTAFLKAKREIDRVRDESLLDQSTGLYNMRGLARRAREIGAEAYRHRYPLACVAFVPEAEGVMHDSKLHDELALRIAEHLGIVCRRSGRISDAIGRLGLSEFAIIAPSTEARGAVRLVERLQETLESTPLKLGGQDRLLRIRAGYCAVEDYAMSSIDAVEMLLRAASALRQLRSDGREGELIRAFTEVPIRFIQ